MKETNTNMQQHRAAIVIKEGKIGGIFLTYGQFGNIVGNYDPRTINQSYFERHHCSGCAKDTFDKAIKTTQERGWTVVYAGQPNWG